MNKHRNFVLFTLLLAAISTCLPAEKVEQLQDERGDRGELILNIEKRGRRVGRSSKAYTDDRWGDGSGVRGTAGVDYPNYNEVPRTSFKCKDQAYIPGMYADVEAQCQAYHVCHLGRMESFLCAAGTVFNQEHMICDYWYSVDCNDAPKYFHLNAEIGNTLTGQPGDQSGGYRPKPPGSRPGGRPGSPSGPSGGFARPGGPHPGRPTGPSGGIGGPGGRYPGGPSKPGGRYPSGPGGPTGRDGPSGGIGGPGGPSQTGGRYPSGPHGPGGPTGPDGPSGGGGPGGKYPSKPGGGYPSGPHGPGGPTGPDGPSGGGGPGGRYPSKPGGRYPGGPIQPGGGYPSGSHGPSGPAGPDGPSGGIGGPGGRYPGGPSQPGRGYPSGPHGPSGPSDGTGGFGGSPSGSGSQGSGSPGQRRPGSYTKAYTGGRPRNRGPSGDYAQAGSLQENRYGSQTGQNIRQPGYGQAQLTMMMNMMPGSD
ncbi:S-antigen protein-like isoform X5 [Centruroides sculpturatus]|uniref:S-antigen protein-like isoform X5 n=1 Tax=Centruroides sculpturatus TaxID=218467 RepID=UPI000C6E7A47|nr:S-antigen protein-like isoform X5 [Centruroides sculpturatus]